MLIVLAPALVVGAFVMFDCVVRIEYAEYRARWLADGRPHGFFWVPDEAKGTLHAFAKSTWAFNVCYGRWLISTPDWVIENPAGTKGTSSLSPLFLLHSCVGDWLVVFVSDGRGHNPY